MDFTDIPDDEEDTSDETPAKRPGCLLGLFRLVFFVVAALLLIAGLLPTLLSSDAGRDWVLKKANAALSPTTVSVEDWSFGWFHAPRIEKIRVVDPAHGLNATVDQITLDRGLIRLLPIGRLNAGTVLVKNPAVTVRLPVPGQTTQAQPPPSPKKEGKGFVLPLSDVAAILTVENGSAHIIGQAPEAVDIRQMNASVTLESYTKPIGVQTLMHIGNGSLALDGRLQSLMDFSKGTKPETPTQLTLKPVRLDLTALAPLIQHVTGEPWIRSGTAEGALTITASGVSYMKLDGGLLVNALSLGTSKQPPTPQGDLALMTDLTYDEQALAINRFDFSSPWLRAQANGTLKPGARTGAMNGTLTVRADADLATLTRDFSAILNLSPNFTLTQGHLSAAAQIDGSDTATKIGAQLTTSDLAMRLDGEPLIIEPSPSLALQVTLPYGRLPEIDTFNLQLPFAQLSGKGRIDAASVNGRVDLTQFVRQFKRALKHAPPMVGSLAFDASTTRDGDAIAVNSRMDIADLAMELKPGQRTVVSKATLKAEGRIPLTAAGMPDKEILDARISCALPSSTLSCEWKQLALPQTDRDWIVHGFTLSSDLNIGTLRELSGGFLPASAVQNLKDSQGRLIVNATAEAAAGVIKARFNAAGQKIVATLKNGTCRIPDIRLESAITQAGPKEPLQTETTLTGGGAFLRDGETVFAEPNAKIEARVTLAATGADVQISRLAVTSSLADLQAKVALSDLKTRCAVDADGEIALDFAALTQLLDAKGIDEVRLTGRERRAFHFSGPVAGGMTTLLSEGTASAALYLKSMAAFGIKAGASDISLKLANGKLQLAYTPTLNDGKLSLTPMATLERGITTLSIPPQTRILDDVKLNQEMADILLAKLNPLFQGCVVNGGSVTLDARSCQMITGVAPDKGISADMDMMFKNLSVELGSSLSELMTLLKLSSQTYRVERLPVHITVKEGRVIVDPVQMVIDRQPVRIGGWTGFDGTIGYQVEVPLTDRLIGGTGGKILQGQSVVLPVTGTVRSPQIDARALQKAIATLLKNAVREQAAEKVGTFLDKLQKELKK